jgi:hypothetical protein
LVDRARELVEAAELGPEQIGTRLTAAGAPEPGPDALTTLAAHCVEVAMVEILELRLTEAGAREKGWRMFCRTAERMLLLLPAVIWDLRRYGRARETEATKLQAAFESLASADLRMPGSPRKGRPWHKGAVALAKTYRETVDPRAAFSGDGAGARFLVSVLSRAYGSNMITEDAVERALERARKRGEI